jgi:hypothetical protein
MAELFSDEWMKKFKDTWNTHSDVMEGLAPTGCQCYIGYGYQGEDTPRGYIAVESGTAMEAGAFEGQELNWDMRAKKETWDKWMQKPPGMMGLGTAVASGKMKFSTGDFKQMAKDPAMAKPFIKTFAIMSEV